MAGGSSAASWQKVKKYRLKRPKSKGRETLSPAAPVRSLQIPNKNSPANSIAIKVGGRKPDKPFLLPVLCLAHYKMSNTSSARKQPRAQASSLVPKSPDPEPALLCPAFKPSFLPFLACYISKKKPVSSPPSSTGTDKSQIQKAAMPR